MRGWMEEWLRDVHWYAESRAGGRHILWLLLVRSIWPEDCGT